MYAIPSPSPEKVDELDNSLSCDILSLLNRNKGIQVEEDSKEGDKRDYMQNASCITLTECFPFTLLPRTLL